MVAIVSSFSNIIPKGCCADTVVGTATCPICKQTDIVTINDRGQDGSEASHYLENHHPVSDKSGLCKGSEMFLRDFP